MTTLFDAAAVDDMKQRLRQLTPATQRLWGTMGVAQALAHCSGSVEMALGERVEPRMLLGRIIGRLVKPFALRDASPLQRNAPTTTDLTVTDERDFDVERDRLCALIDRFAAAGPAGCTRHPHPFFGRLTPHEWAVLQRKHLDHHLRQFGV